MQPTLWVVAGPNGAGKSTLVDKYLHNDMPFINADIIARELNPTNPEDRPTAVKAGREAIRQREALLAIGQSFVMETTLSGKSELAFIKRAKDSGYKINLAYVCVESPNHSIGRVFERIQSGGHSIPVADIRRRFDRSLDNLADAMELADRTWIFNNSGQHNKLVLTRKGNKNHVLSSQLPEVLKRPLEQSDATQEKPQRKEYVETVATRLIQQLEQGTAPWLKPWEPGQRFLPYNAVTGKTYQGLNVINLMTVAAQQGYEDSRWLTYKQALAVGAQVRKGEHGTGIQFWQTTRQVPAVDEDGNPVLNDKGEQEMKTIRLATPFVRSAVVFNAAQVDGLAPALNHPALPAWERHELAETILKTSEATIQHVSGNRAYYQPVSDKIVLPLREQFASADRYYATALHELGHWTGHESRLKRDLSHPFGSEGYAKEELRAEIASMMLGEQLSLGHDPEQHVAYVKSWIKVLQDDPQEIFRAASDAEKITQYLRGMQQQQQQGQEAPTHGQDQEAAVQGVPVMSPTKTYLAVTYPERGEAKALGAKWDKAVRSWYVPPETDLAPFSKWMTQPHTDVTRPLTIDPREEFQEALRGAGLVLNALPEMDGKIHRVPVQDDKPGERSGAYSGFLDGHPAGFIQNFKTGLKTNWKSQSVPAHLTDTERAALTAEAANRRLAREAEQGRQYETTAQEVAAYWETCHPATAAHPYLAQKGVQPHGIRENDKGNLVIPLTDSAGRLWSLQNVTPEGDKSFWKGAKVVGNHHLLGTLHPERPLLITEGFATGATLHEASGLPVAVAFSGRNLAAVAQQYRQAHPTLSLVIAGDNDHTREQANKTNTGSMLAENAAALVGGVTLLPSFTPNQPGSDWNDWAKLNGTQTLAQTLPKQLEAALAKQAWHQQLAERQQTKGQGHEQPSKTLTAAIPSGRGGR